MKKLLILLFISIFSFPTLAIDPFSVIYEHEWKGTKYQILQEYKSNNTITSIWKGDNGSSYLDYKRAEEPISTWKWQYDGSDSNGERFIYSEIAVPCLTSACATITSGVFADYIYDFDNNIVTVVKREDGSIWKEGGTKIISHNFGNSSKKIGENFLKTTERKNLNTCSEITNNKVDENVKGYKDIFFGMTEDEFKLLVSCKKGSIMNLKSNDMGEGLLADFGSTGIYKYKVNAIFRGQRVTEIIVWAYRDSHNVKFIDSNNSGIPGIDEIKNALGKKYNLLFKPSDKSIEKYNEFIDWNEVDFVFQNKDTQNLVLLRVGYFPQGIIKHSYTGRVHYLSEHASKTYLSNRQSQGISADDF